MNIQMTLHSLSLPVPVCSDNNGTEITMAVEVEVRMDDDTANV